MNHETILSLSPDEHLFSELHDAYETALARLEPEVRETLMLSRNEKLKYSEIAKRLNISSPYLVEARISKAIKFPFIRIYRSTKTSIYNPILP